jgi:hypothetical protein
MLQPVSTTCTTLESLPIEVLHNVFFWLDNTYLGADQFEVHQTSVEPTCIEALYALAASSRTLLQAVESFSRHALVRYKSFTKYDPSTRKRKTSRVLWVKWKTTHCAFCGGGTQLKARFNPDVSCCRPCDKKFWTKIVSGFAFLTLLKLSALLVCNCKIFSCYVCIRSGYYFFSSGIQLRDDVPCELTESMRRQ